MSPARAYLLTVTRLFVYLKRQQRGSPGQQTVISSRKLSCDRSSGDILATCALSSWTVHEHFVCFP